MNDNDVVLGVRIVEAIQSIFRYASVCVVSYFVYRIASELAGKDTVARFALFLVADLKANTAFSHVVSWVFGVGCAGGWWRERRLRRKNIQRFAPYIHDREKAFDPNRSSSGLTTRGTTRPEDLP